MNILWIYFAICLVEALVVMWMIKTGRWRKLEDKKFGEDAWKNRITQFLPEGKPVLALIILFFSFFIGNPLYIWELIKNTFNIEIHRED